MEKFEVLKEQISESGEKFTKYQGDVVQLKQEN